MLGANDVGYYGQRAAEATNLHIVATHGEMADRYAALVTTQTEFVRG